MSGAPDPKVMLSEKELALRWGVSTRTIKRRREAGEVPDFTRIGRKGGYGQGVMYRLDDVIKFEDSRKEHGNADSN